MTLDVRKMCETVEPRSRMSVYGRALPVRLVSIPMDSPATPDDPRRTVGHLWSLVRRGAAHLSLHIGAGIETGDNARAVFVSVGWDLRNWLVGWGWDNDLPLSIRPRTCRKPTKSGQARFCGAWLGFFFNFPGDAR